MLKFRTMQIKKYQLLKKCLLCGNGSFLDLGQSKCPVLSSVHHLNECNKCGFVFVNPMPNEKELGKIYSFEYRLGYQSWIGKILDLYNSYVFVSDAKYITSHISSGKVIDIGYGSGGMLNALGRNWEKYGYDEYSSNKDRELIKKRLGINTLSTLSGVKSGSFDLVIMRNVIEHTADFKKLFANANRLLKPGGLLFIRTPNIESLDFKIFGPSWYMTYMGGHLVFFSTKTLAKTSRLHKFKPIKLHSTLSSPLLSFQRNMTLKYSIDNSLIKLLLLPLSLLYSIFSLASRNGNDLLAILKKY